MEIVPQKNSSCITNILLTLTYDSPSSLPQSQPNSISSSNTTNVNLFGKVIYLFSWCTLLTLPNNNIGERENAIRLTWRQVSYRYNGFVLWRYLKYFWKRMYFSKERHHLTRFKGTMSLHRNLEVLIILIMIEVYTFINQIHFPSNWIMPDLNAM